MRVLIENESSDLIPLVFISRGVGAKLILSMLFRNMRGVSNYILLVPAGGFDEWVCRLAEALSRCEIRGVLFARDGGKLLGKFHR